MSKISENPLLVDIDEKIRLTKEKLQALKEEKKFILAAIKCELPPELSAEEEGAIAQVAEEYLEQKYVTAVTSACSLFRARVVQMRYEALSKLSREHAEKRSGRPRGSGDHNAKMLINSLARIWETAFGVESLPRQSESRFGSFVAKIAKILDVGKGPWQGQIRQTLGDDLFAKMRDQNLSMLDLPYDYERKRGTVDIADIANKKTALKGAVAWAITMCAEKSRLEAEIKKIPGIENFRVELFPKNVVIPGI